VNVLISRERLICREAVFARPKENFGLFSETLVE
jgi:hypothetical protein